MKIIVADKLYLQGFPPAVKAAIRKGCEISNPLFHKMRKMGKPYVHLSEYIRYWEEDKASDTIAIGVGNEERLRSYCASSQLCPQWEDRRVRPTIEEGTGLASTIELRDYQVGVPERIIQHERGVCSLDTGYGKTIVALKVAELLQTRTLIITHLTNVYEQFKKDIETYFGFTPWTLDDTISKGPEQARIVLCTIQTLQRRLNNIGSLHPLRTAFGLLIADEAHKYVPAKSRRCIEWFQAAHRYGFTATPERGDGQGEAIKWIFGPVIVEGAVERAKPTVSILTNNREYEMDEYFLMVDEQVADEKRQELIASTIAKEIASGRKVLVLTKRIAHYEELYRKVIGQPANAVQPTQVFPIASRGSRSDRAAFLANLRTGEIPYQCLFGTFSLLSTGVDIPSLDTLIIAGDLKSDILTKQSAGRILRLFEGKPEPKIIDVFDCGNPVFRSQGRARQALYRTLGWPMKNYGE